MFNNKFSSMVDDAVNCDRDHKNANYLIKGRQTQGEDDSISGVELYVSPRYSENASRKICHIPLEDYERLISKPANRTGAGTRFCLCQYLKDHGLMPVFYKAARELGHHIY